MRVVWIAKCTTGHCRWMEMCKVVQNEENAIHRLAKHSELHTDGATGRVYSLTVESGVEMGKVNRVEAHTSLCKKAHEDLATPFEQEYFGGGSAETGGEKAAPELNMTRADDGRPQFLWFGGKYYTIEHPECMDALLKAIRSSGVEGAHEGTTADKSEPEKLNNAQKWISSVTAKVCHDFYMTAPNASEQQTDKLQQILEVALAESSLSHDPNKETQ